MRILFICGSVEPGKDGVGDYTRRLAAGFISCGNEAAIVAINEKKISEASLKSIQSDDKVFIQTYRLSNDVSWKTRQTIVSEIVNEFDPEIISFQFVPFSFHNKGMPFFLPNWLKKVKQKKQIWHVMFHELWIADSKAHSVKELLMRELQKVVIKKLLAKIRFDQIDTSNSYYQKMLSTIGYDSGLLPIFSNLPKGKKKNISNIKKRDDIVIGVFFGNIQPSEYTFNKIISLAQLVKIQMHKQLCIIHIGNSRSHNTNNFLLRISKANIQVNSLGFLNADDAADVLASSDFGLSNYPPNLIHKSGGIASLLHNNLPVVLLDGNEDIIFDAVPEVAQLEQISDINKFIHQEKIFFSRYSSKLTVEKLKQKFSLFQKI